MKKSIKFNIAKNISIIAVVILTLFMSVKVVLVSADSSPSIAVTVTGLNDLKVNKNVHNAKIIFTLSDGTYADITSSDFYVSNLPSGLTSGTSVKISATVVEIPISGTPTSYNANTTTLNYSSNIPLSNVAGATTDIVPTGEILASAVAKADPITVDITGLTRQDVVYDGLPHTGFTGVASSGAYTGNLVYEYTGTMIIGKTTTAPTNAGSYTLTVSVPTDDEEYNGTTSLNFVINKVQITITGFDITKVYDGNNSVMSFGNPEFVGFVNNETAYVDAQASATYDNENIGIDKPITFYGSFEMAGGTANASNYSIIQPTGIKGKITAPTPTPTPTSTPTPTPTSAVVAQTTNNDDKYVSPATGVKESNFIFLSGSCLVIIIALIVEVTEKRKTNPQN